MLHGQLLPGMGRSGKAKSSLRGAERPCPIGLEVGSNNPNVKEENECCRSCGFAVESLGSFRKQSVLSWECWERLQPARGTAMLFPGLALPGDTPGDGAVTPSPWVSAGILRRGPTRTPTKPTTSFPEATEGAAACGTEFQLVS